MPLFTVSDVTDGDTFQVEEGWIWWNEKGQKISEGKYIRPTGYNTPEEDQKGYGVARQKLKQLIQGKIVELKNPVDISGGRLVCDVYYNGKPLKDYFPEHQ